MWVRTLQFYWEFLFIQLRFSDEVLENFNLGVYILSKSLGVIPIISCYDFSSTFNRAFYLPGLFDYLLFFSEYFETFYRLQIPSRVGLGLSIVFYRHSPHFIRNY